MPQAEFDIEAAHQIADKITGSDTKQQLLDDLATID